MGNGMPEWRLGEWYEGNVENVGGNDYSLEINKKNTTRGQVNSLLLWKQRAIFLMVSEGGNFGKEMSHKILRHMSEFKLRKYISFVGGLLIFLDHLLKNKNKYLHYMKKIYVENFQVYMY